MFRSNSQDRACGVYLINREKRVQFKKDNKFGFHSSLLV